MDTALFVGLAHRAALQRRMDVVAHNIANMSTTAFNKEKVIFQTYLIDVPGSTATGGGKIASVIDRGVMRNLEAGTLIPTNNPLDVFIHGRGYLSVQGKDGKTYYTRNGRMKVDTDNELALLSGEKVLDDSGKPIRFQDDDSDYFIAPDGTISTKNGERGKLALVAFANEQNMKRRGSSLYETNQSPIPADQKKGIKLQPKAIEGSNVNAIESMVEMIDVMRAYERASKSSSSYENMRRDSLDRLARVQ
ncbi:flagellar hook-basal body complex protein [Kordiimonas marina]|uniref:flagellar hook-basal body complex protein n=1 Tax=Kordiimonas marina TaxID=2872312 RepID=UPI001FF1AF30|nr:flagellar hook-basal body complex protein [Kordiimonas marina]MCJ9430341.1 flagellar hook-basal body complex protein [Kordiimonas marina]